MADNLENNTPENNIPESKELTPAELKAQEQGWVPQEQWEGDPDKWRPAKEFLDRGELFQKIDVQSRELKELRKALADLQTHNSKIAEVEYKRALNELKAAKKAAYTDGDVDAILEIDEKIEAVKDAQREAAAAPAVQDQPVENPVFTAWVDRNGWYSSNRAMRAFADQVGREAASKGMSPTDVLQVVEREVKKEFAEKFQNQNRAKAPVVESSTNKSAKSKDDSFELSDTERRVMQRFINTIPGFNKEKYIADLKKIKGD